MQGILTIQSWVAYGHVGNAAAMLPLQLLGFETWAVNTVQFSNHPGHGAWRGRVGTPEESREIVQGIEALGVFPHCAAVLSGYLGDAGLGAVVLEAVAAVKRANPAALWCCDPVMGDVGDGFYVRPGLPEFFRDRATGLADIVTPNQFELEFLAGRTVATLDDARAACAVIRARGPKIVLVTSLRRSEAPSGRIEMLAASADGAWLVETPLLPIQVNGAGDAMAALFLGNFLKTRVVERALAEAAASLYGVLDATHRLGEREIQLVAAQDELVRPSRVFPVRRVG